MLKKEIFEFFVKEYQMSLPTLENVDLQHYTPIKNIDLQNGIIVRRIYLNTVYTENEDKEYSDFVNIIEELKDNILEPKEFFRFYYKNNKNPSSIISNLSSYKEFIDKNFQILKPEEMDKSVFNQSVNSTRSSKSRSNLLEVAVQNSYLSKLINSNIFYVKGMDKKFHPNLYFDINRLSSNVKNILFRDFHRCFVFYVEYILNYLMTPGKIENFNLILNLNISDYKTMSEFEIKYFSSEVIKTLNNFYPFRINNIFILLKPNDPDLQEENEHYFTSIKEFIVQVFSNSPRYIKNSVYVIDNGIEVTLKEYIETYPFKILSLDCLLNEVNNLDLDSLKPIEKTSKNIPNSSENFNLNINKEKSSKIDSKIDKFDNNSSKLSASDINHIPVKKKESLKLAEKSDYNSIRSYKDYSIYDEVNTYENAKENTQEDGKFTIDKDEKFITVKSHEKINNQNKEVDEENYEFPTNANIDIYANEQVTEMDRTANDDEVIQSYQANENQFTKIENIKYTKQERVKGSNVKMGVYQSPSESKVNTNVNNTFLESNLETNRNEDTVTGTDTNFFNNSRNVSSKVKIYKSEINNAKGHGSFQVEQEREEEKVNKNGSCCSTESCLIF